MLLSQILVLNTFEHKAYCDIRALIVSIVPLFRQTGAGFLLLPRTEVRRGVMHTHNMLCMMYSGVSLGAQG